MEDGVRWKTTDSALCWSFDTSFNLSSITAAINRIMPRWWCCRVNRKTMVMWTGSLCTLHLDLIFIFLQKEEIIRQRMIEFKSTQNYTKSIKSFLESIEFCRLQIFFANSLEPDQAQQNVGPDQDQNCLTTWWYSWKNFSRKLVLKKNSRQQKIIKNYLSACKELGISLKNFIKRKYVS